MDSRQSIISLFEMTKLLRILIAFTIGLFYSCTDFVAEEPPKSLSTNPTDIVTIELALPVITIRCGEAWDITSLPNWAHVASIERSKSSIYEWDVLLSCDRNSYYNRSGEMVIETENQRKTLILLQNGEKGEYVALTGIEFDKTNISMSVGDNLTLFVSPIPINASDCTGDWGGNWTSSNPDVVAFPSSDSGHNKMITAKSSGTATITFSTYGFTATCIVTVSAADVPVTSVSLDKTYLSMSVGDVQPLTVTVEPSNATDKTVIWSSSNISIATVSSSGEVTAKSEGTAIITATSSENPNINATCSVTVLSAPQNTARIVPNAEYVIVDNAVSKDYSVQVTGRVDNRYHYYLDDQPFKDYIKVVDYSEDSEALLIDLKTITSYGRSVVAPTSPVGLKRLNEDKTVANLVTDMKFKWGTFNGLEYLVAARLIPAAQQSPEVVVDSATVRVWTKNPIPVFEGGDMLVVEHGNGRLLSANIAANLDIKDLNGISLNGSSGLRQIGYDEKTGEVVVNYDQALNFGTIKDFKLISGAAYIEELDISWDANKLGTLNLLLHKDIIVSPIIIQVPVYLKHMFDRGLAMQNTAWVTVKFVEKQ